MGFVLGNEASGARKHVILQLKLNTRRHIIIKLKQMEKYKENTKVKYEKV